MRQLETIRSRLGVRDSDSHLKAAWRSTSRRTPRSLARWGQVFDGLARNRATFSGGRVVEAERGTNADFPRLSKRAGECYDARSDPRHALLSSPPALRRRAQLFRLLISGYFVKLGYYSFAMKLDEVNEIVIFFSWDSEGDASGFSVQKGLTYILREFSHKNEEAIHAETALPNGSELRFKINYTDFEWVSYFDIHVGGKLEDRHEFNMDKFNGFDSVIFFQRQQYIAMHVHCRKYVNISGEN